VQEAERIAEAVAAVAIAAAFFMRDSGIAIIALGVAAVAVVVSLALWTVRRRAQTGGPPG
jgi:hypothetical protein